MLPIGVLGAVTRGPNSPEQGARLFQTATPRTQPLRRRFVIACICTTIAVGELIVLALLSRGVEGALSIGALRISIREFEKPLIVGLALSIWVSIQERRSPLWRRLASVLMVCFGLLAVVNFARQAPPITALSDIAVTELYTLLAAQGRLLVGPYSRFGWHHPGPLYFWLQAPFYALSGYRTASLYAGAVAINIAALITLAWVMVREDRGPLALLVTAAPVLFAWRIPTLLSTPWTAHVPAMASLTFVVLCAAVASGRLGLLPLTIVFGSFIAQTHLGFVPLVVVLSAGSFAAALYAARSKGRRAWKVVTASAWLALALWLFPIAEQLSHAEGNLWKLWRFFSGNTHATPPVAAAFADWAYMLVGVLRFEGIPSMGHFVPTQLGWGVPLAIAEVLLLPVVAVRAIRRYQRFEGSLASTAFAASMVGLWSITRIRDDVLAYEIFWLSGLGAINLAVIAAAAVQAMRAPRSGELTFDGRLAGFGVALIVAAGLALGIRDLRHLVAVEQGRRRDAETVRMAYQSIRDYLNSQQIHKPMFRLDPPFFDLAAAAFVRLQAAGVPFAVQRGWLPIFTDAFAVSGDEDAVVTFATRDTHEELRARARTVTVLELDPVYIDAVAITANPYR